jgi:GNAT superfamily N-acetyltransferase
MFFKLNQELIDNLIFAMENQHQRFLLDSETMEILPAEQAAFESAGGDEDETGDPAEERCYPVPEWSSADGYQLMEKFVSTLHNPIFRQVLREALTSGKGVFRNFKNALKRREDVERLWYAFKEKEMRARILEWYERLCDAWEVEAVGPEPPETEELVLSDFILREGTGPFAERMSGCDHQAFRENLEDASPDFVEYIYRIERNGRRLSDDPESVILRAETPAGEFAGFIWGVDETEQGGGEEVVITKILQLYVAPEYRGLGLSKIILDRYLRDCWERGVGRIVLSLFGSAIELAEKYAQHGFRPLSSLFDLDLENWGKQNGLIG